MTGLVVALAVAGAVALVVVGLGTTVIIGMRTGSSGMRRAMKTFNKVVTNPLQLRIAGKPGAQMSILYHRGRVSGREYATPIGAVPMAGGGFVVALPYGPGTDWLRNLRAAGSAVLRSDGFDFHVDQPQVVPIESTLFASDQAVTMRLFGVASAVRLHAARVAATAG